MAFDRYTRPSVFNTLCASNLFATSVNFTDLTAVQTLSVLADPAVVTGLVATSYVHTNTLTAINLSASNIAINTINATSSILSASTDLFDLFLTPNNTLTTSVCAMSGDGVTPFVMQFTNGLLTFVTV